MLDTKGFGRCSFSGLTHSLGLAADRCALSASLSCIMGSVKKSECDQRQHREQGVTVRYRANSTVRSQGPCMSLAIGQRLAVSPLSQLCRISAEYHYNMHTGPKDARNRSSISLSPLLFYYIPALCLFVHQEVLFSKAACRQYFERLARPITLLHIEQPAKAPKFRA